MALFTDVFEDVTKWGKKIPTSKYLDSGMYPIIDQGQNDIAGYTNEYEGLFYNVPAIIFGDHTRIIKYVDTPFFIGADGVKIIRAKDNEANYKFLYYALSSVKIPNTGYNRHFKWLKEAKIPDFTKEEKQQIVTVLNKVSDLIDNRKEQLKKLDELVKSRFIEMFGDPVLNQYNWDVVSIGDIVTDIRYGTSRPATEGGKYPYLRMNNLTYDGYLDLTDLKYIDIPENEIEKCIVHNGDVLFNRTNSIELVGKTCVFDLDDDMVIAGYIIRVRLNDKILPIVLSSYMNSTVLKEQLKSMAKGAVNQANINAQELQSIEVYLPPIELQEQFAAFVAHTDKLKFEVKQGLEKLETLKKSLMQQYFG